MLKNYFTTAIRNLSRNRSYALINVLGLSIGISCAIIAFLMVNYMTGFDKYHTKKDRIYRIVTKSIDNAREDTNPGVPIPLAGVLEDYFPEIEKVSLYINGYGALISAIEQKQTVKQVQIDNGLVYTDNSFYQILDRKWIEGNATNALSGPNTALISKSLADKLFPNQSALNKIVDVDGRYELKITGVLEDVDEYKSDFNFQLLVNFSTVEKEFEIDSWGNLSSDVQCLVVTKSPVTPEEMESKMQELVKTNYELAEYEEKYHPFQPLADIHHNGDYRSFHQTVEYSDIVSMILMALFLIITASINFVNLATAQAVKRSKEVGVRKVLGGYKRQIQAQFLIETMIISLLSILLSLGMAELMLIKVNEFLELNLKIGYLTDGLFWIFILMLWFGVSFLSGTYPGLVISKFNPITALKNTISSKNVGGRWLRHGLVVFQFIISQVLIIGVIVIMFQINFLKNNDMGFEKEAVLTINLPSTNANDRAAFANKIKQLPSIVNLTNTMDAPASNSVWKSNFILKNDSTIVEEDAQIKLGDVNYLDTYGIQLAAGKMYSPSDSINGFLINEKLSRLAGFTNPEDAIGKEFRFGWIEEFHPITGVVKDFHSTSFRNEINPTAIFHRAEEYNKIGIKLTNSYVKSDLAFMKTTFNAIYPGYEFNYKFMDEVIERFYRGETRLFTILQVLTFIAIFIGCLGLYGLVSYMANQKVKEIGIRKILGASFSNIILLFSKEFAKLIGIAFLVALPLGYYGMNTWLQGFMYKIEIEWWIFASALLISMGLVMVTVGYRTIKSAMTNPIHCLKDE